MLRPFLIALQFLTRIPLALNSTPREGEMGRSLLFYPLIGLLIGVLLVITATLSRDINLFLSAALVVTVWVIITGGLHLDGLADTADAWIGGMGSKAQTLKIMKDPASGPMGVLNLVLLIQLKTAAVYTLLSLYPVYYLIIPPVLGRGMAILLLATIPYVREAGLGYTLSRELSKEKIWLVNIASGLLLVLAAPALAVYLILFCAGLLLLWRHLLLKRLAGCTGDTVGALIEITEVSVLINIVLFFYLLGL